MLNVRPETRALSHAQPVSLVPPILRHAKDSDAIRNLQ